MKTVQVTGPGTVEWVEIDQPTAGPNDVLLAMKATGICGSDAMYTMMGGVPPHQGCTILGHEPAAEVAEVGANVEGIAVGDHVVIDTMTFEDGLLGSGGAQGGMAPFVVVKNAKLGVQLQKISSDVPWDVAALNEPMAVAMHGVNVSEPTPADKVVIFGAGPIGLGALLGFKSKGVASVVLVDVLDERLATAQEIGADAIINGYTEDVAARLIEIHGEGPAGIIPGQVKPDTDIYYDAAGAAAVLHTTFAAAKRRARLTIVASYTDTVEVPVGPLLTTELQWRWAVGYPTEIFEVTKDIEANWEKYQRIISHRFPFDDALEALTVASTPGAADKVTIVFE
ncbi:MAG: alcohol dehydrogenase catalytic domain-containing protein [Cellulomonadaceae bacterium]|jgi:threonine dehydrogenase-like Zn-dependent dehydrogenase|nr:alcohol dehydrogenase catalytic domain-containing protein [Cellulomonadaceae bacterium]